MSKKTKEKQIIMHIVFLSNLDISAETYSIIPATGVDIVVEYGGVVRHPGTDDRTLATTHRYLLTNKTQQL